MYYYLENPQDGIQRRTSTIVIILNCTYSRHYYYVFIFHHFSFIIKLIFKMSVVIETTIGDITVDLYIQHRPQSCNNFLKLCKIKYYNGCNFHFIQRDFIAQTGDPTNSGKGGRSAYSFISDSIDELKFIQAERKPKIKHNRFGLISMVNNGENLHGSQFFFTLCDSLDYLDDIHTVFGEVVEGENVLVKLNDTICDEQHRPYQDIIITHTVILDDPFPEIKGNYWNLANKNEFIL